MGWREGGGLRCVETGPELLLVARPGAHDYDCYVGLLGCFDCLGEAGLVVAPAFAALGVVDRCLVADGGFDAVQGGHAAVLAFVDDVVSVLRVSVSIITGVLCLCDSSLMNRKKASRDSRS